MNLMVATIIVVVAMCDAEPPRFRHFQRQSVQPSNPEAAAAAPYPPSGYRPTGAQFSLPQKEYGAPAQGYGPPDNQQPQATTTELPETTTGAEEEGTTTEPQAENIKIEKNDKKRPVFLVVPRAQQLKSQSYVTYVQEYPEVVDIEPEEVVFEQNAAIYNGKLQAVPVNTIYNPYAYFQIYQ